MPKPNKCSVCGKELEELETYGYPDDMCWDCWGDHEQALKEEEEYKNRVNEFLAEIFPLILAVKEISLYRHITGIT